MKSLNKKSTAVALGLVLGVTASTTVFADSLVDDIDQNVLQQQQIDVDGQFNKPDPLEKMRKDLAAQHNKMVDQKINTMRIASEKKLGKQLQKAFAGGLLQNVTDTVSTGQAAVVKAEVAPAPNKNKEMRIMPQLGYSAIKGETERGETMDFESKINVGLQFEADVHNHIAVGISLGYQALDITDFSNSTYSNMFNTQYTTNSWYTGIYGSGRELSSKQVSLDLVSKFYATGQDSRFRPYLGLGLGVSHLMLKYKNTASTTDVYGLRYGDEQFSTNYITGTIKLGSLVNFSNTVGMDVELSYAKGITSSKTEVSALPYYNIDQQRLNDLGAGMSKADVATVRAGLTIGF